MVSSNGSIPLAGHCALTNWALEPGDSICVPSVEEHSCADRLSLESVGTVVFSGGGGKDLRFPACLRLEM